MFSAAHVRLAAPDDSAYEHVIDSQPAFLETIENALDGGALAAAAVQYCPALDEEGIEAFVAGGFLRDCISGRRPRDLDLYVPHAAEASHLEDKLRGIGWTLDRVGLISTSWRAQEHVVQVIRTEIHDPSECIARFDLTICCAALHLRSRVTYCASNFLADVIQRRLVVHNPAFPIDTLRRISRFISDGYTISADQLLTLHGRILRELHGHGINAFRPSELL